MTFGKYTTEYLLNLSSLELVYKKFYELLSQGVKMSNINSILVNLGIQAENYWLPGLSLKDNAIYFTQNLDDELVGVDKMGVKFVPHSRYQQFYLHQHSFYEIIFVISGKCQNIIEGINTFMNAGDLCIIPPYVRHMIGAYSDSSLVVNIVVSAALIAELYMKLLNTNTRLYSFLKSSMATTTEGEYYSCSLMSDKTVFSLYEAFMRTFMSEAHLSNYAEIYKSLLLNLLLHITDYYDMSSNIQSTAYNTSKEVSEILLYLQTNHQDATLSSTAEHFSYSPSYLSRVLKNKTGSTFIELIQNIRITQSCYYLINTNLTIENISKIVGYKNAAYYIRIFIKYVGITPAEFRKSLPYNI